MQLVRVRSRHSQIELPQAARLQALFISLPDEAVPSKLSLPRRPATRQIAFFVTRKGPAPDAGSVLNVTASLDQDLLLMPIAFTAAAMELWIPAKGATRPSRRSSKASKPLLVIGTSSRASKP
jgi:hypothetical protein